jgi:hypothetical protein
MITEVLSPVLYKAIIHNKERVVHALNIKPANRQRKFIKKTDNKITKQDKEKLQGTTGTTVDKASNKTESQDTVSDTADTYREPSEQSHKKGQDGRRISFSRRGVVDTSTASPGERSHSSSVTTKCLNEDNTRRTHDFRDMNSEYTQRQDPMQTRTSDQDDIIEW